MCTSVLYVCVSVHHVRLVATEAKEGISTLGTGDKDGREPPRRCWGLFTICTPPPHNSSSRQFELVFFLYSKTQRLLVETEPLIGLLSCKLTSTHLSSTHLYKHTHTLSLCNVEPAMSLNKGAKHQRKDSRLIRGVNKIEHSNVADLG